MKIGIIGAGNVGISSAFAIAEQGAGKILLYDAVEGRAVGKALDLAEAAPIRKYEASIQGVDDFEPLFDSDIFVLTAGVARKENQTRADLLDDNLKIVNDIADKLKAAYESKEPPIVLVMPEPVDLTTLAFLKRTGWPKERVFGVAGILTSSRLRHFLSKKLGILPNDIDAIALGTHGKKTFIPKRYSRISGLPVELFLDDEQYNDAIEKTLAAGDDIVNLAKIGSSFYTPGAAVGALVRAVADDSNRVVSVSTFLTGEYGANDLCASTPVKLGASGIKKVYELALTSPERGAFAESIEEQTQYLTKIS